MAKADFDNNLGFDAHLLSATPQIKKATEVAPFLQPKLLAALLPNVAALRPDAAALLPKDVTVPQL